jgi:hypothetical protein
MNKKKIAAIAATGLFSLMILPGAVMDIVQPEMVVEIAEGIGLPLPIMALIGFWKLAGLVGLWQPKFARLREWAYAGFFFDLTGAAFWHGSAGDMAGIAPPLVILGVLAASYGLRYTAQAATVPSPTLQTA